MTLNNLLLLFSCSVKTAIEKHGCFGAEILDVCLDRLMFPACFHSDLSPSAM